jgi:hypothetical protein
VARSHVSSKKKAPVPEFIRQKRCLSILLWPAAGWERGDLDHSLPVPSGEEEKHPAKMAFNYGNLHAHW